MASPLTLPPLGDFAYQAERLLTTDSKMSQILVVRDDDGRPLIFKIACTAPRLRCDANRQAIHNSVAWLERLPPHPGIAVLQPIIRKTAQAQPSAAPLRLPQPSTAQQPTYLAILQEWPGAPEFVVMDYLPGGTLSDFVRKHPLPCKAALWLTYRLAHAIAHLHAHGCVHRDLKPENILFGHSPRHSKALQELQPVLIDFGVAAGAGEAKLVCGSRQWMAPELQEAYEKQLLTVDPAWDIYALGLISCYMLSGLRPRRNAYAPQDYLDYQARAFASFDAHWAAQAAQGEYTTAVSEQLNQLLQRTLAQEPTQRPTAPALMTEIKALLATLGGIGRAVTPTVEPVRRQHSPTPNEPAPHLMAAVTPTPAARYAGLVPKVIPWRAIRGAKLLNRYTIGGVLGSLLLILVLALSSGNQEPAVNAALSAPETQPPRLAPALVVIAAATPTSSAPTPTQQHQIDTSSPPTLAALPSIVTVPTTNAAAIPTLAAIELISVAPPTLAALPPTATLPPPTPTPLPTATVIRPPTNVPTTSAAAPVPVRLRLLAPAAAEVSNTARVEFIWETVGAAPTAEQCFELVFWDPQNSSDKRSPVGANRDGRRTVNFAALRDSSDPLLRNLARSADGFDWGVRLVDCRNARTILQDTSDSRHYTYQP